MTERLTFKDRDSHSCRTSRWAGIFAGMLIAAAVPTVACEKSHPVSIASTQSTSEGVATFTGEFVNGAPVYRLPTITVLGRREIDVAGAPREAAPAHPARSSGNASPKPGAG